MKAGDELIVWVIRENVPHRVVTIVDDVYKESARLSTQRGASYVLGSSAWIQFREAQKASMALLARLTQQHKENAVKTQRKLEEVSRMQEPK